MGMGKKHALHEIVFYWASKTDAPASPNLQHDHLSRILTDLP